MASTPAELQSRLAPLLRDENEAWRALAPAWKLEPGEGDVCQTAQREQLQCFKSARTSLALIRQLDRPGVLTLQPENDKAFHVLLTGLSAHSATLRGASASQTVSLELLTRLWRGEFATFWRAPPGVQGKIVEGNSGAAAVWLASKLDGLVTAGAAPASSAASSKPPRPSPLKARVHDFQLAQGLEADGVIGPTTFMQLNRALGIDEPRLQAQR